jgi:hypothetical protein
LVKKAERLICQVSKKVKAFEAQHITRNLKQHREKYENSIKNSSDAASDETKRLKFEKMEQKMNEDLQRVKTLDAKQFIVPRALQKLGIGKEYEWAQKDHSLKQPKSSSSAAAAKKTEDGDGEDSATTPAASTGEDKAESSDNSEDSDSDNSLVLGMANMNSDSEDEDELIFHHPDDDDDDDDSEEEDGRDVAQRDDNKEDDDEESSAPSKSSESGAVDIDPRIQVFTVVVVGDHFFEVYIYPRTSFLFCFCVHCFFFLFCYFLVKLLVEKLLKHGAMVAALASLNEDVTFRRREKLALFEGRPITSRKQEKKKKKQSKSEGMYSYAAAPEVNHRSARTTFLTSLSGADYEMGEDGVGGGDSSDDEEGEVCVCAYLFIIFIFIFKSHEQFIFYIFFTPR